MINQIIFLLNFQVLSLPHLLPEQMHFDSFKGFFFSFLTLKYLFYSQTTHVFSRGKRNIVPVSEFSCALEDATDGRGFFKLSKLTDLLLNLPIKSQMPHFENILQAMTVSLDEERWPRALVEKLVLLWERFDRFYFFYFDFFWSAR